MSVHLRFLSLTVTTAEAERTYRFDKPATVITGPIGTGKSSLLMLLKHTVGGNAMLTPAVRENVLSVQAEIEVGTERFVVKRAIEGDPANHVDLLDPDTLTLRSSFPTRATPGETTISDYLLDTLGFPREQVAARRDGVSRPQNLTFNDLYAYIYMQAREIDRQVIGHLDSYFDPKRKELFRLMFALTNSALMELKRTASALTDELKSKTSEHNSVDAFLLASDPRSDDELRAELTELRDTLQRAESTLTALRFELSEQSAADTTLREELRYAIQIAQEAEEEVVAARELVDARQSVVAQVELDVSRLNRSAAAIDQLSPYQFVACPRCMQSLTTRHIDEGHCVVCLQPDPAEADIDSAAIEETRAVLRQQLDDAHHIEQSDITHLHSAHQQAQQASFLVSSLRRELDAQSRDVVAPRFDAIADASSRVATLKASIDAVTQLRDSWSRVRAIEANIREIKKTRRQTNKDIKDMSQKLAARQATVIDELSRKFGDLLRNWNLPWVDTAVIDNDSYLPIVNGQPLESQQASGGGIATSINVAYSLTLLAFGLDHSEVLTPSLLVIDSPRKAFGNNDSDRERAAQIYDHFRTLATTYGKRLQLIIADNDPPPISSESFGKVEFTYENPMVPGVVHPGPDHVDRIGDEQVN
ncbi:ATP-binding protein [Rhodococcus sp. ARC_M6]|uniref:ATP-binding protein n=1 Tax=Rhodococcus sp. ARC_M6 TaxID=2928852 RepID=UPI001FB285D3|nr:ATP-binding protein [Rhodococcus sp. ARC_M6]MCJ0905248.1 AAA family ATPase [Rhodococcus sp. ARC_M6]